MREKSSIASVIACLVQELQLVTQKDAGSGAAHAMLRVAVKDRHIRVNDARDKFVCSFFIIIKGEGYYMQKGVSLSLLFE